MAKREQPERVEQKAVCTWLDGMDVLWFHTPNEGIHKPWYRKVLAALGLKAGVPDVMIFDPPPLGRGAPGVSIELKPPRGPKGGRPGKVTDEQRAWLLNLQALGWLVAVCYGANEAITFLESLGYGPVRGAHKPASARNVIVTGLLLPGEAKPADGEFGARVT